MATFFAHNFFHLSKHLSLSGIFSSSRWFANFRQFFFIISIFQISYYLLTKYFNKLGRKKRYENFERSVHRIMELIIVYNELKINFIIALGSFVDFPNNVAQISIRGETTKQIMKNSTGMLTNALSVSNVCKWFWSIASIWKSETNINFPNLCEMGKKKLMFQQHEW